MTNTLAPAPSENAAAPSRATKATKAWRAYRNGPNAAVPEDEFLQAHLPLVRSVIERIKASLPGHVDADDLLSAGLVGLVLAARAFNAEQGASFTTYATLRIRGAVFDELRRMDWMPRRARTKAKQLKVTISELEQKLGRVATEEETAMAMNLSPGEYADLLNEVRPITCLELDAAGADGEDDESNPHELVADSSQETAVAHLEKKEILALMAARIEQLPDMSKKVLALYYFEELRLAEIAQVFGVTESRICQIHGQAIISLRAYMKTAINR
jgi:RNA polymerase sigma factor for flagellar operon FliA